MKLIRINSKNLERRSREIEKSASHFDPELVSQTERIVEDVRKHGDSALFRYAKKFDRARVNAKNVRVSDREFKEAARAVAPGIVRDLKKAASRIRSYQRKKLPKPKTYKDTLGNELGWLIRPIEKVGIYVPGGKASYPSTVLMTAIPARVAGASEISVVTPCSGERVNPEVLVACEIAGVSNVYKIGGAHAIAAIAFGTRSIPKVDKVVGPGNIYVTIAKKLVYGFCDIDMLAGPTEVLIIADGSCPAKWVASDLLAQAEHDEMSIPILATTSHDYAKEVKKELLLQLEELDRKEIAGAAVSNNGRIYVTEDMEQAVALSNAVAPEHLELCVRAPKSLLKGIKHAGAVFLGSLSTEPFGDYVSGPSHVLPTGGAARFSSPLSVYDFLRMPSTISMSRKGFSSLGGAVMNLAHAEGLSGHAFSVKRRIENS
ncbi:MAG: histidinol dehydrogenase [Candidatus Dadabacteria bacterium]|nr:histidinol dehydrogenase [Candidatus Dadabacteria bacterium]MYC40451.1 histidinol dehydrogenase [Candidatus Dadabacteria bacterium]